MASKFTYKCPFNKKDSFDCHWKYITSTSRICTYDKYNPECSVECNFGENSWIISENGCVIACPNCGERLELCYPDGTEVRYLPHCPWCGKKLEEGE